MKVLFTADIHIRLGQKSVPKDWAINRYKILWKELDRVYEEYDCDLEIHGGDIFDKLPSIEELEVYFSYIARSKDKDLIIFDGNHEATRKGQTFMHNLKDVLESLHPTLTVVNKYTSIDNIGDFLPYTEIKKNIVGFRQNPILFTHVRAEIPPHVKPEIDLDLLNQWDWVFAGDLHAHSNSQRNIVYPGSPVTVTFHRNKVDTGVIILDTVTNEWEWVKIKVPQLIRKTIEDPTKMVKTDYDHTIYEIVGDMVDLAKVDRDTDILDKKIVKYESEASLDLSDLSIEDEIYLYLMDILQFDNDKIDNVLRVYNDNTKGVELE